MKNKFNIGDLVYHISPESEKAVILDINYSFAFKTYIYTVSTGFGVTHECAEHELNENPRF